MMEPQTTPNVASIVETAFTWPKGFYSDGLHAGLKAEKPDLGWLFSKVPARGFIRPTSSVRRQLP